MAAVVRGAAAELGCSPRSVWRWLAAGPPAMPARATLDEELYGAYVRWHGNFAAAHRELAGNRQ